MFAYQDQDDDEPGHCFSCGGPAPWLVLIGGEDEPPRQEWACELHARGHRRLALVTPPSVEVVPDQHFYWRT